MGTVKYPAENGEKAGKALIQLVPMFSDLYVEGNPAKRIAGLVGATLEGVETITIWEVTGDFNPRGNVKTVIKVSTDQPG